MKERKNKTPQYISFRVKEEEYRQIHGSYKATTCRKLSQYARQVLLKKPVVILVRNKSADDFLTDMLKVKKELSAIGNNLNQAVHKLHTLDQLPDFRSWILMYDSTRQSVEKKVEEILVRMEQIYNQWSRV